MEGVTSPKTNTTDTVMTKRHYCVICMHALCKLTRRLHRRSLRLPTRRKWAQWDNCVLRRLWLRQGLMQGFLGLKVGGGS